MLGLMPCLPNRLSDEIQKRVLGQNGEYLAYVHESKLSESVGVPSILATGPKVATCENVAVCIGHPSFQSASDPSPLILRTTYWMVRPVRLFSMRYSCPTDT